MRVWVLVLMALSGAACVQAWGIDDLSFHGTPVGQGGAGATGGAAAGGSATAGMGGDGNGGAAVGGSLPSCGDGFVCVPAIDAGSYVTLVDEQAGCPAGWADPTLYAAPTQPGCSECGCADPPTGTCTATLRGYDGTNCNGQDSSFDEAGCYTVSSDAFRLQVWASTESCQPTDGEPVPLDGYTACTLTAIAPGTCAEGSTCVPSVAGTVCNLFPADWADVACPPGYLGPWSYAEVLGDDRQCSCDCGPSTGQSCNWEAVAYDGPSCTGSSTVIPSDDQCTVATATDSVDLMAGSWSGGHCAPLPTTLLGGVSFGPTQSVCCLIGL